jgi:hypothetical protein
MKTIKVSLTLTAIYFVFNICGFAQSAGALNNYQIGNKKIAIPAPIGFTEATSQVPVIKERFIATEAGENDLIAVHLPIEQVQLLKNGDFFDLTFYTKVSVSKRMKTLTVSEANFAEFTTAFKKNFPALTDPGGKEMKAILSSISDNLTELNKEKTTAAISQPVNLGLIENSSNVYGTLLLMQIKLVRDGKEATQLLLCGLSAVRVREKILFIYTYKAYEKEKDVAEIKQFSKKWINQIIMANTAK